MTRAIDAIVITSERRSYAVLATLVVEADEGAGSLLRWHGLILPRGVAQGMTLAGEAGRRAILVTLAGEADIVIVGWESAEGTATRLRYVGDGPPPWGAT